jgi:FkbM family methyltransferase
MERTIITLDRLLGTDLRNGLVLAVKVALQLARGRSRLTALVAGVLYGTGRWNRPIRLDLARREGTVRFEVPDFAAFKVLGECLLYGNYAAEVEAPPRCILDLGANIGASALYFRERFPDARIVCVEASPRIAEILRRNVAGLDDIEVRHAALARDAGTITFYESADSWAGSTAEQNGDGRAVQVAAVTLEQLLRDTNADLVKIDVEGAEFEVLPDCTCLDDAATYMGEIHAPPDDPRTRRIVERFAQAVTTDCGGVTLFTGTTQRS